MKQKKAISIGTIYIALISNRHLLFDFIGEVQKAHRFASRGITLKHSGHFCVDGSAAFSFFVIEMSLFIGTTTKK